MGCLLNKRIRLMSVLFAVITNALGLLQLIALKFKQSIWNRYTGFLWTTRAELRPSYHEKFMTDELLISILYKSASPDMEDAL